MNVETPFKTNAQFAETGEPGMRALDYPPMPPEAFLAFYTATGNAGRDAALLQVTPTADKIVALVRMQLARAFARLAIQARDCRNGIERLLECHRVVSVRARDRDGEWNAASVYNDVPFRPELSSVCRVGAGFLAPGGWTRWRHQGSPVPNQSGRVHVAGEASRDAAAPIRLQSASPVVVASMSCRCRNPLSRHGRRSAVSPI